MMLGVPLLTRGAQSILVLLFQVGLFSGLLSIFEEILLSRMCCAAETACLEEYWQALHKIFPQQPAITDTLRELSAPRLSARDILCGQEEASQFRLYNSSQLSPLQYTNIPIFDFFILVIKYFDCLCLVSASCLNCYCDIIKMYNQKFTPYGGGFAQRGNQLYEEDEYQQEESQPLVEEVDDSYQPTDRQVREYAVETLGMRFPQDEGLLYLARQGLKAPLPDNWVPYQGRDGQVYYKHRITQEKTYDHPTDLEYRKKYEQQKEKMARKNLKSMNMKASNQFPIGQPPNLNPNASNLFASNKLTNSGFMGNSSEPPSVKLDPRIQQEYEEELENLDERMKREWKEYEMEERQASEGRVKKLKQEYETEISKLYSGKQKEVRLEDKLREEKERIKGKLEQQLQEELKEELREYQKEVQAKNKDFHNVYEEDMHFRITKYQQEKDSDFDQRQAKLQENIERLARQRENRKKQMEDTLKTLRIQFQNGKNKQIEAATADALHQEIEAIQASYAQKLKQKQEELEREYLQTKRVLGFDQNAYLSELASKKARIKAISQQKIDSFKKKEMQALILNSQNHLEHAQKQLKEALSREHSTVLQQQRIKQEQRIVKQKERLDREFKVKIDSQIQNIYDQMKRKIRVYQTQMNKKLSSVQERFIDDIHGKSKGQSRDITFRLETKEKELALQNKTMLITSLKRQIQLQLVTLALMRLQSELYHCKDQHQVDTRLLALAKQHSLQYRSDKYLRFEATYRQLKERCKKDKEFLASVMGSLQNQKGSHPVGGQAVLKQYNQDVRLMRDNEDMLRKMEALLKRAEVNDKSALQELSKGDLQYQDIQLRRDMTKVSSSVPQLSEMQEEKTVRVQEPYSRTKDIETALKDHSRFLSTMRNQLNRKLYQIRSGSYY